MTRNFNIKKPHLSRVVMAKALLFAACVVCVYLFMPRSQADKFQYQLNKTWNYDDIIAPFDVEIYYTPAEQKAKVDSATETITPVYYRNDAVADEVKAQVSSRLALDADKKHAILAHLHNIYTKGILELDARTSPSAKEVTMRNEYNVQSNVRVNNYYTAQEAYTEILNKFNSDPVSRNAIISDSLSSMLRPNIDRKSVV